VITAAARPIFGARTALQLEQARGVRFAETLAKHSRVASRLPISRFVKTLRRISGRCAVDAAEWRAARSRTRIRTFDALSGLLACGARSPEALEQRIDDILANDLNAIGCAVIARIWHG